ncbi:MAG: hypothetical protein ACREGK_04715 [Geminicoccales bacterium]
MTKSGMRDVLRRGLGIGALAWLVSVPGIALAQTQSQELIFGGVLGDIRESTTTNEGKVHVAGGPSAASADYFRGGFDDVPSDLDEIAIGPDLSVVFELWEGQPGPVRDLSLTLGTQNNFADQVQPTDSNIEKWYESNNFAALTARLGGTGWARSPTRCTAARTTSLPQATSWPWPAPIGGRTCSAA